MSTSTSVNAVTMMPTASGRISRAAFSRSRPVILGMRWSVTITATSCRARQRQRLLAAAGQQKLEGAAEIEPERVQVVGLVVDHEHRVFRRAPAPCAIDRSAVTRQGAFLRSGLHSCYDRRFLVLPSIRLSILPLVSVLNLGSHDGTQAVTPPEPVPEAGCGTGARPRAGPWRAPRGSPCSSARCASGCRAPRWSWCCRGPR